LGALTRDESRAVGHGGCSCRCQLSHGPRPDTNPRWRTATIPQAAKEAAARDAAKAAKKKGAAGAKAGVKGGVKKAPIGKGKGAAQK
jgi:hypothetical protein